MAFLNRWFTEAPPSPFVGRVGVGGLLKSTKPAHRAAGK